MFRRLLKRRLTLDGLKTKHPDVYEKAREEIYEEAREEILKSERERFRELDAIVQDDTDPVSTEINSIIERAKYETGQHATDISIEVLKLRSELPVAVAKRQMSRLWYVGEG